MANVLITGVSSGYGHALAETYLARGFQVFGMSRRKPEALLAHPGFHFETADVSKEKVASRLEKLLAGVSRLDLVILNAGVLWKIKDMAETPLDRLQWMMDVNVWANKFILDFLFSDYMAVDQVVAISSGAAVSGARGWNGYSISKAALNMLIKLYAQERPQTHFTALAPGLIETAMQDQIRDLPQDERFPSVAFLQQARGTPKMPKSPEAAARHAELFPKLRKFESGGFLDVRALPPV